MSIPVGIVTGASSGIGLAVTEHLLSRGYRVVVADVNASEGEKISAKLGKNTLFLKTDVTVYAEQAILFREAFAWGRNRLDFLAANAGIDDRQSLYEVDPPENEDGTPKELNLKTIRVDLDAVFQGIWLFKHYAGKNAIPGGKVMITPPAAGL
jgi:15-hydroxyprostaglandin dehydrogenase (NAD)